MIKHVILWKLKDEFSENQKIEIRKNVKSALENLKGNIDGLLDIKVNIELLNSSNADMMLDSTFTDENSLNNYQKHPMHVAAADTYVRPFAEQRLCLDYKE